MRLVADSLILVASAAAFGVFAGCKHVAGDSEVKVTNGVETADYPAVVKISTLADDCQGSMLPGSTICTGTFVSDTTMLTAAHCLSGDPDGGMFYCGKKPTRVFFTGPFGDAAERTPTDFAVLVFPEGTAPATVALGVTPPAVGDTVTLVGFGMSVVNDASTLSVKRKGTTRVLSRTSGFVHLSGLPGASSSVAAGEQVASGPGDSGGPMFLGDGMVGTDETGGVHNDALKHSYYIDLASPQSCALMRTAIDGGAAIDPLPSACASAGQSQTPPATSTPMSTSPSTSASTSTQTSTTAPPPAAQTNDSQN